MILDRLETIGAQMQLVTELLDDLRDSGTRSSFATRITDFDLPFFTLVGIIAKIALASIPTIIIGGAVLFLLFFLIRNWLGKTATKKRGIARVDPILGLCTRAADPLILLFPAPTPQTPAPPPTAAAGRPVPSQHDGQYRAQRNAELAIRNGIAHVGR
jgi:hypothetical protein